MRVRWQTWELVQSLRCHELQPGARCSFVAGLGALQDAQQRVHALRSGPVGCSSACPQLLVQQQLPHLPLPRSPEHSSAFKHIASVSR